MQHYRKIVQTIQNTVNTITINTANTMCVTIIYKFSLCFSNKILL